MKMKDLELQKRMKDLKLKEKKKKSTYLPPLLLQSPST